MFSSFHAYDDEGYYLATLADYLSGHPLLGQNAPLYGPFFYELYGGLFKLFGLTPDNDTGRVFTVVGWLVASLLSGLVAWRLSRNLWLGVGAQLLTFSLLSALTNEPMGTYAIVSILLLGITAAAVFTQARPRSTAALIGAMVGALCLIKINIGGLAAIAVVFAWAAGVGPSGRPLMRVPVIVVVTILPFVLTAGLLRVGWVLDLAFVEALSILAIGVAVWLRPPRRVPPGSVPWMVAGGALVAAASIGVAVAGGTHVTDVWGGLILAPVRFTQFFMVALSVYPVHVGVAALSCAAAIAVSLRYRGLPLPASSAGLVRVGVGFFILLSLLLMPNAIFIGALPLAWIATQAPEGVDDPAGAYARVLVPALAVLEVLQAYPIAGTQASMAGLGLIPVGAIILGDGIRQLRAVDATRPMALKGIAWAAPSLLGIVAAVVLLLAITAIAAFSSGTPLGVRGAQQLRLPERQAADLRHLVAAIDQNCSSFFTFPSMSSLYIWTGQDPPTAVRAPIWWLVLDTRQQQSVVQELMSKPRLCVVTNTQVVALRSMDRPVPSTPLVDFINRSFVHEGTYGAYELLVRSP